MFNLNRFCNVFSCFYWWLWTKVRACWKAKSGNWLQNSLKWVRWRVECSLLIFLLKLFAYLFTCLLKMLVMLNAYDFELYQTTSHIKNCRNRLFNLRTLFVVYMTFKNWNCHYLIAICGCLKGSFSSSGLFEFCQTFDQCLIA